jgi:hypothetical protein
VSVKATPIGDGEFRVVATVSGMPEGGRGVMFVNANGLEDLDLVGSGCDVGDGGAVCGLSDTGSETFEFVAEPRDGRSASMTFSVWPFFGTQDPNLSNNIATVTLTDGDTPRRAATRGRLN